MPRSNICKYTERRIGMDNNFMDAISVEKFAAFLDGNLPSNEMNQFSSLVETDGTMHELFSASKLADETMLNYSPDELTLPAEMTVDEFVLPNIDSNPFQPPLEIAINPAECDCDTIFENDSIDNPATFEIIEKNDILTFENPMDNTFYQTEIETAQDEENIMSNFNE